MPLCDKTLILLYNDLAPYDYSIPLIESDGANALLKKIDDAGKEFNQPFTNDTGFTYNSSLAEFVAGILSQKDQRLNDEVFFAKYNSHINGNWGDDLTKLAGIAKNGASIIDEVLDISGAKNVEHATGATNGFGGKGGIGFYYYKNYIGNPALNNYLFEYGDPDGKRKITMCHASANGAFYLQVKDDSGAVILNTSMGGWNIHNEIGWHKFIIPINCIDGAGLFQLWIDDDQIGTDKTSTGTRTLNPTLKLWAGSNGINSFGKMKQLTLFDVVPAGNEALPINEGIYSENKVDCPQFSYNDVGNIQAWESLAATLTGAKFIHNGNWHNGSIWTFSNGSYIESNTLAEVQATLSSMPISDTIIPSIVFEDSNIQQSIDLYRLFYTGQKYTITAPWIMITSGTYLTAINNFIIESTIPVNTSLKFSINVNGIDYYWDGVVWSLADGTSTEANTAAELNDNIADFDFGTGKVFKLKVFLITTDDQTTPLLFKITMNYNFAVAPTYPIICRMYGFVTDLSGKPIEGATITFSAKDFYTGDNLVTKDIIVTSEECGFYDADLVRTIDKNIPVTQIVEYTDADGSKNENEYKILVPNEEVASIANNLA